MLNNSASLGHVEGTTANTLQVRETLKSPSIICIGQRLSRESSAAFSSRKPFSRHANRQDRSLSGSTS
jgi:hypothetical protein